jgi:metal-responsive CopG/Arc/MetJ family transcriptional regulator
VGNRKAINIKLPPDLLGRVDEYCRRQPAPPSRTSVIEAAICGFLDARIDDGSLPRRARERQKERT